MEDCAIDTTEKKKRGRKKKEQVETVQPACPPEPIQFTIEESVTAINEDTPTGKKRGRKPRGGKLVLKQPEVAPQPTTLSNVILHLKCSLSDLNEYNNRITNLMTDPLTYKPDLPTQILTYNEVDGIFNKFVSNIHPSSFESETQNGNEQTFRTLDTEPISVSADTKRGCGCENMCIDVKNMCFDDPEVDNVNIKDVNQKLKYYKIQLYKNAMQYDKKSACFWCTYEYDNPPCYIPKYEMDDTIYGYGSFCRPECAVAYLMKENLDDSTKFERYHLLNQIYSKVYDCKKNIKPAPNPYYLLDKFYGNLTIQEYRKLLKTEHLLLVLDKPFTRILPELHEDTDELITNIYGVTKQNNQVSGVYKVKRQSEKQQGPSKASIIRNKFGLE